MSDNYVTVGEIAELIGGIVLGDAEGKLYGIKLFDECTESCLTFTAKDSDILRLEEISAGAVIVNPCAILPAGKNYIVTAENTRQKLYKITSYIAEKVGIPQKCYDGASGISNEAVIYPNAVIESDCFVGKNTVIHSGAVIEKGSYIGENCEICANAVVHRNTYIGDNTYIGGGSVVGCNGFEVYVDDGIHHTVQSVGGCIIGSNVHINSNTVIQRGTIGDTVIGDNTQIGSQVTVGHEVKIGKNCRIVSTAAVAGWAVIGDNVNIFAQAAVANNVRIGDNACILARAGVSKDVPENSTVSGYPAQEHTKEMRYQAYLRKKFRQRS